MGPGQFEARLPPPPNERDRNSSPAPPAAARPARVVPGPAHAAGVSQETLPPAPSALSLQQQMLLYQQQGQDGLNAPVLPIVGGMPLGEHEQQLMYQAWAEAEQQNHMWDDDFLLSPLAEPGKPPVAH